MWRSKLSIAFLALCLILAACSNADPTPIPRPTATATKTPTPTPVPPPTATPQVIEILPDGCIGWLKGFALPAYLCSKDLETTISLKPGQCGTVVADQPLKIHFRGQNGSAGQVIKQPGETICTTSGEDSVLFIWAETIGLSDPLIIVADQESNGGFVVIDKVVTPLNGWLVISTGNSKILGRRSVEKGITSLIQVVFPSDVVEPCTELVAMLHADFGEAGEFELPGPDVPLLEEGVVFKIIDESCPDQ